MFFRSLSATIFAAATLTCSFASAATYDALSHLEGNPSAPEHSLWFSGGSNPSGATGPKANHFLFETSQSGYGTFSTSGNTASLTGTVLNAAGQGFDLLLNLVKVPDPNVYKNPFGADTNAWMFYGLDPNNSSMLTSLTAGISSFDISLRGAPLEAQFGVGANDKNAFTLGFSTWIWLTEKDCTTNCERYGGDINISLVPAPLPASIALLPVALGAFGFVGARRRPRAVDS